MSDLNLDLNAIRQRNADIYAALPAGSISEPMRQHFTEDVPDLIADVRRLTAELDAIGRMRVIEHEGRGLKVITVALHDRLCTARVASRQDTTPPVLHCHFCGFCYPPLADTSEQKGPNSRG